MLVEFGRTLAKWNVNVGGQPRCLWVSANESYNDSIEQQHGHVCDTQRAKETVLFVRRYNTGGASARYYQIYVRNVLPLMSHRPRLRYHLPETLASETITTKYVPVKFQFKNHRGNSNGNLFHNIRPLEKLYTIRHYAFFFRSLVWVSTRGPHIFSLKIHFILTPLLFEGFEILMSIRLLDVCNVCTLGSPDMDFEFNVFSTLK